MISLTFLILSLQIPAILILNFNFSLFVYVKKKYGKIDKNQRKNKNLIVALAIYSVYNVNSVKYDNRLMFVFIFHSYFVIYSE